MLFGIPIPEEQPVFLNFLRILKEYQVERWIFLMWIEMLKTESGVSGSAL